MSERPLVWSDMGVGDALRAAWPDMDEQVRFSSPLTRASEADELHDAAFVISRAYPLTASDFERMGMLVGATSWGVGYNHIDLTAASAHGIPVAFNPVFTTSVVEAAITLILALAKRLPELVAAASRRVGRRSQGGRRRPQHRDRRQDHRRRRVRTHRPAARRVRASPGHGRHRRRPRHRSADLPAYARSAGLAEALPLADVVVLVLPLTPETHYIVGAQELALMKPTAYLVNVGRGGSGRRSRAARRRCRPVGSAVPGSMCGSRSHPTRPIRCWPAQRRRHGARARAHPRITCPYLRAGRLQRPGRPGGPADA